MIRGGNLDLDDSYGVMNTMLIDLIEFYMSPLFSLSTFLSFLLDLYVDDPILDVRGRLNIDILGCKV